MNEWWSELTQINQWFYYAAAFFSVFFIWQLIAVFLGLSGDDAGDACDAGDAGDADLDGAAEHAYDDFEQGADGDAAETVASFKLLSIRSIVAFFTLFTWGGALYLGQGLAMNRAMAYSVTWGLVGAISIALVIYLMKKLTHTGTKQLATCVGTTGAVYLDIPADGNGQVRVTVSGIVTYVKARSAGSEALKAGTPVKVIRQLGQTVVEVAAIEENK